MAATAQEKGALSVFGEWAGIAKIILTLIGLGLIVLAIYLIYKQVQKKRIQDLLDNNYSSTGGTGGNVVNIGTKASEIFDALHGSWFSEDETKAVNAVLTTPKASIPQLSSTYYTISGGINLKQDLQDYLSSSEWLSIAPQFN